MRDALQFCSSAVLSHSLRTTLSILGVAIGIAAVVLLTTIGEGARKHILDQFTQFGTNVLSVHPGKSETLGLPGVLGGTTQKLSLDDAAALGRLPQVAQVVPIAMGMARVEAQGLGRSVMVYGVTHSMPEVWKMKLGQGSFLPPGDPRRGSAEVVLGSKLKRELFGDESALGQVVRAGGTRLRVIGVMAPKGRILGFDIDDSCYLPVATAMRIFNLDELQEIHVTFAHEGMTDQVVGAVTRLLTQRHRDNEDFTVTTQGAMLDVFGNVMRTITIGTAAIGGISLLVGAIGILTMMWISVGERTSEVGLLRALGATSGQVLLLFLGEAVVLALLGGVAGIALGLGLGWLIQVFVPGLPLQVSPAFMVAAIAVSVTTGLLAGVLPARRAARLDPIEALRAE